MSVSPVMAPATAQEAGRNCPYCRFPLKEGADTARCGSCHAAHHADCWADNRGCAVMGCAAAPASPAAQIPIPAHFSAPAAAPPPVAPAPVEVTLAQPAGYQPAPPVAPPPINPTPPPAPSERTGGRWLVGTILVLALVIAGAAIAIVLTRKDDPTGASTSSAKTAADVSPEPTVEETAPTPEETFTPEPTGLDAMSESEMSAQIQDLLLTWHEDIVNGDYRAAWNAYSARQRHHQIYDKYGYGPWVTGQEGLHDYLDPSGLRVHIDGREPEDVVRVRLTGMTYSAPSAHCADHQWKGITWVKYEGGEFTYDPGWSTTAARDRKWSRRPSETLGAICSPPS